MFLTPPRLFSHDARKVRPMREPLRPPMGLHKLVTLRTTLARYSAHSPALNIFNGAQNSGADAQSSKLLIARVAHQTHRPSDLEH